MGEAYGKFKLEAINDEHWVTIDADRKSIEQIHEEIIERTIKYREEDMTKFNFEDEL